MGFFNKVINTMGSDETMRRIDAEQARNNLNNDKNIILLDVREDYEYKGGHIKGAINLPVGIIEQGIKKVTNDKEAIIYVYCQSGARSTRACQTLSKLGYTQIYNLGGISSWPYEVV